MIEGFIDWLSEGYVIPPAGATILRGHTRLPFDPAWEDTRKTVPIQVVAPPKNRIPPTIVRTIPDKEGDWRHIKGQEADFFKNGEWVPVSKLNLIPVSSVHPLKVCHITHDPRKDEWSMLWFARLPRIGPSDWRIEWSKVREDLLELAKTKGCTHFKEGHGSRVPGLQVIPR